MIWKRRRRRRRWVWAHKGSWASSNINNLVVWFVGEEVERRWADRKLGRMLVKSFCNHNGDGEQIILLA